MCDCASPQTCNPGYLPQGYTSACEETYDSAYWNRKPGLRCNVTDPDTKQTFCAVSTCDSTYEQFWYNYPSYSYDA